MVDASQRAIRYGETNAPLWRKLHNRGVRLYSWPDLHAKVLLLDRAAVIGSGNMSALSKEGLVEARIVADMPSMAAGIESCIEQLIKKSPAMTSKNIKRLCAVEVVRTNERRGPQRQRTVM